MIGLITLKGVLKYAAMPQIFPRLQNLLMGGFGYVPYFIAVVYQMVGLLPSNHPYLKAQNIGKFGMRHVIGQAANNLQFDLKHLDQIIMFVAVLLGSFIFIMQLVALGAFLFLQPVAAAMPTNWNGFFVVDSTERPQDLAFIMLDMVFGVPDPNGTVNSSFFESCIGSTTECQNNFGNNITDFGADAATNTVNAGQFSVFSAAMSEQMSPLSSNAYAYFPFPYHVGLHQLFFVYSTGLLVVAFGITSYFIATILAETAQTGTAFGKRFNKMWAPLRIVVAFGLLMPLSAGMNSSQYAVLYAAKYGSAFATNGWKYFNDQLTTAYTADGQRLISVPHVPDYSNLFQFLHVAKSCKYVHEHFVRIELGLAASATIPVERRVEMYLIGPHSAGTNYLLIDDSDDNYNDVSTFANSVGGLSAIRMRFGVRNEDINREEVSNIGAECGEVIMEILQDGPVPGNPNAPDTALGEAEYGIFWAQAFNYSLITEYWFDDGDLINYFGTYLLGHIEDTDGNRHKAVAGEYISSLKDSSHEDRLDSEYVNDLSWAVDAWYDTMVGGTFALPGGGATMSGSIPDIMHQRVLDSQQQVTKGWAAAGIWYNSIAQMNGGVVASLSSIPEVRLYPKVMETMYSIKMKYDKDIPAEKRFEPVVAGIDSVESLMDQAGDLEKATAYWHAFNEWTKSADMQTASRPKSNPFLQAISYILGTDGLYDMRNNPTTHPLAQLTGIGRSLVESSVRSLGWAALSVGLTVGGLPKSFAKVSASFFVTVAMLGLTVGFLLFYVVPFLPFIYFIFAVGGWIKGIFEALVGAPLWALAHIRIDGHGLSGQAATNGYFLIFEVFIRPILIIFGLLASVLIFSALVTTLNSIFSLVTENVGGYDVESELIQSRDTMMYMRSLIDEFFFTVIYAILVYMLGMSSFKLIDTVPNNILRWMGQSVATFGDQRESPAEAMTSRVSVGSQQVTSKIGGGLQQVVGAATKG